MAFSLHSSAPRTASVFISQRPILTTSIKAFKVTFISDKGISKEVMCDDDEYLLDAADAGGVDLPASCRGR